MELSDIKLFQVIAKEGSISGAAKQLNYVQSNVTARLQKLENELGVLLFYRKPKGVQLTEKGVLFQQYADSILRMVEESIRVLQDHEQPNGSLRIGVVETVTCGHFIPLIASYQSTYNQVELSIETGQTPQLLEKVKEYDLDAALVTDIPSFPWIEIDESWTEELVVLSHDEFNFTTLLDRKWVVSSSGCPFRKRLEEWLQDEGGSLENYLEIHSLEILLSSVKAGLAATLLPRSVLKGAYEDLYAFPIPEKYRYMTTALLRRKEKHTSYAYQAFCEMVKRDGI
ncbi:LysR family transcriptional regulator [Halalkalibacterium halodurans]|uniref:LysR family transcriptional regulator n=1 Tax=Halalkalibacterium halodurans TaxID=86665 RepID=UPI002E200F4D|nr:LysR family transcriptional regulator [Halalkalibacterium halodurans]MED4083328.1 LysR family transcriptional regulator [Halalkalibacterium halodurans]MED4106481.1 LysR family transcriptional regulator [Halalkalibacterium halodurans]MED4108716.1 LysR family transcriptional regulator [Halalkalibacterium halodurans]MED4122720.1 LysR family transcriptional regulator [Halalkalibacterium halodurans]